MHDEWRKFYRIDSTHMVLVEVEAIVASADGQWMLVKGDKHTTYKGSLFSTPEDAFIAAYADIARSEQYNKDRRARLDRTKQKYEETL